MTARILLLALAILIAAPTCGFSDEKYGFDGTVNFIPRDRYDLQYLGLIENKNSEYQQGVFLLTWKGIKTTGIVGFFIGKPLSFYPATQFSYHFETGWQLVPIPERCGFGMSELKVQPGERTKLIVDMSWLEADFQKPLLVKKAKQAALVIGCREGMMISNEFPLPLVP